MSVSLPMTTYAANWYLEDGSVTVNADNSGQTVTQGSGYAVPDEAPVITQRNSSAETKTNGGFSHDVASLLTKLTTYKSGITEVTGVKMLNNTMTVTDKFSNAYTKETDETSPRAKGMRNYKERIKKISKQKRGQMFKKQLEI